MNIDKQNERDKQFLKKVQDKFGDVYNILEDFKRSDIKIQVQHKCEDGEWYTWGITPSNLLHGKGLCPKCSKRDKGQDAFERKVFNKVNDEYIVLGEYKYSECYLLMKHNTEDCQHEFMVSGSQFINNGTRCPKCSPFSKAEDYIKNNLTTNLISHSKQYIFKDCKFKKPLRFDFAVFEDKEKTILKYLIEYQGSQHYSPQRFNGISQEKADKTFKETVIKDKIKEDYCAKNNIELLIIPYWDFDNIDKILEGKNQ